MYSLCPQLNIVCVYLGKCLLYAPSLPTYLGICLNVFLSIFILSIQVCILSMYSLCPQLYIVCVHLGKCLLYAPSLPTYLGIGICLNVFHQPIHHSLLVRTYSTYVFSATFLWSQHINVSFFLKMGHSRPLFLYFVFSKHS